MRFKMLAVDSTHRFGGRGEFLKRHIYPPSPPVPRLTHFAEFIWTGTRVARHLRDTDRLKKGVGV